MSTFRTDIRARSMRSLHSQLGFAPLVGGRDPTQWTNQCNDQSSHGTDHSHAHHRREAKTRLLQQSADHGREREHGGGNATREDK